jgi:hypothetical protein
MIRVTRRPAEVLVRLRRAETRLDGLFFMFYAGATYMTANSDALFLTTLLGYESDAILKANFDFADVNLFFGRWGGLAGIVANVAAASGHRQGASCRVGRSRDPQAVTCR